MASAAQRNRLLAIIFLAVAVIASIAAIILLIITLVNIGNDNDKSTDGGGGGGGCASADDAKTFYLNGWLNATMDGAYVSRLTNAELTTKIQTDLKKMFDDEGDMNLIGGPTVETLQAGPQGFEGKGAWFIASALLGKELPSDADFEKKIKAAHPPNYVMMQGTSNQDDFCSAHSVPDPFDKPPQDSTWTPTMNPNCPTQTPATPTPPMTAGPLQCDPEMLNRDVVFMVDTSNPIQPDMSADLKLFYIKAMLKGMFKEVTDWGTMRSVVLQYGSSIPNANKMEMCENSACFDKQIDDLKLANDEAHYLANPLSALMNSHFSSMLKDDVAIIIINDGYWMYEDDASDGAMKMAMMLKQKMNYSISAVTTTPNRLVMEKMKGIVSDMDYNYKTYEQWQFVQYKPRNYIYRWVCSPSVVMVTPELPDVTTAQPFTTTTTMMTTATTATPPTEVECQRLDVVILIDRSSSLTYEGAFTKVKEFVVSFIQNFKLDGTYSTRFALIAYSEKATVQYGLGQFDTFEAYKMKTMDTAFHGGLTNTYDALKETLNLLNNGPMPGGVTNDNRLANGDLVIVISDGVHTIGGEPGPMAAQIRAMKVPILAVAIDGDNGNITHNLMELATITGDRDLVTSVASADNLPQAIPFLEGNLPPCSVKCAADLNFVVETTEVVGVEGIIEIGRAVKAIVRQMDIGMDKTRVGLVTFANPSYYVPPPPPAPRTLAHMSRTWIKPEDFDNREDLLNYIDFAMYPGKDNETDGNIGGYTDLNLGLKLANTDLFNDMYNRSDAPDVMVLFARGEFDNVTDHAPGDCCNCCDDPQQQIMELHSKNVQSYAVKVGPPHGTDVEMLSNIAQGDDRVYDMKNYMEVASQIKMMLENATCETIIPEFSKCPQYMDVVLLLHVRRDIQFNQMVRFAAELVKGFSIDTGLTRVALVGYGAAAHVEHNLYNGQNQTGVVKSIMGVSNSSSFYQDGNNLMSALQMTLDMVLKLKYGDREFAPNAVVLITDKIDQPDTNLMKLIEEQLNTVAVTLAVGTDMAANADGQKRLMMVTSSTTATQPPRTFFQPKIDNLLSGAGGMYRNIIKRTCDITGPLTVVPPMPTVCIPVSGPTPPMDKPMKDVQVDIILVVDVSRLVNDVGFAEIKAYLMNVLSPYTISPMMTRVALVTYDSKPMVQFHLNSYLDMGGLMDRLRYHWMHSGGTHSAHPSIADALGMVHKDIILGGPPVGYRVEKNNFVFVLATTAPNEHDIMMAQQIRMKGATVAVISLDLDDTNKPMLQDLAGNVLHLQMVQSYQTTLTMAANLEFFWGVTLDPKPPRLINIKADISFVIDTSDSITLTDGFTVIKSFLKDFANPFVIGMNNTQVALVQYRNTPEIVLRFNDTDSTDNLVMEIEDKFFRMAGQNGQNVPDALKMVKDDILKPENGARADVARIVILFLGGPPDGDGNEMIAAAAALNNMDNTYVYPVALDKRIQDDLLNMTAFDADWTLMQSDYINTLNRMGLSYVYHAVQHYYDLLNNGTMTTPMVTTPTTPMVTTENGTTVTGETTPTPTPTPTPTGTTTLTTIATDTTTPTTTTPSGACNVQALHIDMVALFDQSDASFTPAEYTTLTADIADNFVKMLNIGTAMEKTQLGLLKYSDTVNMMIKMNVDADRVTMIKELPQDKNGGKNELTVALSDDMNGVPYALGSGGDRVDRPNVLFIFTGSKPTDMTGALSQADALKSNGLTIVTIGFGPKVTDDDLMGLSSGDGFHATVQTFDNIMSVLNPIVTSICKLPNAIGRR